MRVTRRYNQHRRDLDIDMECEGCGETDTYTSAYDDANFWENVVPKFKCPKCEQTSESLGMKPEDTHTRYPEGLQL